MMTITITIPDEGNVSIHTQTDDPMTVVPIKLERAVSALRDERDAFEVCPFHLKGSK